MFRIRTLSPGDISKCDQSFEERIAVGPTIIRN
jgi:hypothetical protein